MENSKKNDTERDILKRKYKEDIRPVKEIPSQKTSIKSYLGESMGEFEWNHSTYEANKKFVNVDAYESFKDKNSLILVGRTGTGKSSLLKKLEFEVNQGMITYYKDVVFISLSKFILQLSNYTQLDNSEKTNEEIIESLHRFITIAIMKHIVYDKNKSSIYSEYNVDVIEKYLTSIGVVKKSELGDILYNYAKKIPNDKVSNALSFLGILSMISNELFNNSSYYDSMNVLEEIYSKNKMLILIDTFERYNFNDSSSVFVVKALMTYTFNCFSSNSFICLKIALPSELYSSMRNTIPAKQIGNTVFIEWTYRDL